MDILITIAVGGIVGWVASIVMKTSRQMGILANIVVGIVGSVLGNWLFGLVGIGAFGLIGRFILSLIGAMILIAILKSLRVLR